MVVVGKPSAEVAYTSKYQESYWRNIKSYSAFAEAKKSRKETLYAGSNSGVLHAIDGETGREVWGFVPPFVASQMPKVINPRLNIVSPAAKGGSNAVYGVDDWFLYVDEFSRNWYSRWNGNYLLFFNFIEK